MSTINAAPAESILPAAETETLPPMRIFILYEDYPAGRRAKHFCRRLARRLHDTVQFSHSLWHFDMLARPELKAMVEEHGLEADLVMITGCVDLTLPAAVEKSLEHWLPKKAFQNSALVVLLDGFGDPAAIRAPVCDRLRAIAWAAHMEFFICLSGAEHANVAVEAGPSSPEDAPPSRNRWAVGFETSKPSRTVQSHQEVRAGTRVNTYFQFHPSGVP